MKKFIAASAGLLLAGSMVSAASAAVTFTGDARERLVLQRDYDFNDMTNDFNAGRVRLVVNADTKGGAYATVRMRFADGTYDGTLQTGKAGDGKGSNYFTDWAYIGIPIGPVTINAGLMPELDAQAMFFRYDKRFDRVAATYKAAKTSVTVEYSKDKEFTDPTVTTFTTNFPATTGPLTGSAVTHVGTDTTKDQDLNEYGVIVKQGFAADWSVMAIGLYKEDQVTETFLNPDNSGFLGFLNANGSAGPVKLGFDFAYADKKVLQAKNFQGQLITDSGWGATANAKMSFGPADATVIIGQTKNGYLADSNYGFLMIGGAMGGASPDLPVVGSPIQVLSNVGVKGDTFFSGLIGDYKVSNMVKLVGIVAYADIKDYAKLLEISGLVRFDVTDGAYIDLGAGYLKPSKEKSLATDQAAVGAFTELGVKF